MLKNLLRVGAEKSITINYINFDISMDGKVLVLLESTAELVRWCLVPSQQLDSCQDSVLLTKAQLLVPLENPTSNQLLYPKPLKAIDII